MDVRLRALGFVPAFVALAACGARTPLSGLTTDAPRFDATAPPTDTPPTDAPPTDAPVAFDDIPEGACSNGVGLDPIGCVFPDGTRVPFGASTSRGCVDCRCTESGALSCVATRCPGSNPLGIGRGCVTPDGRQVDSASWTLVGATWCYCDVGSGVSCRLGPCEDGGTVLSPPPIVGAAVTSCNDVELDADRVPTLNPVGTSPPGRQGGLVPDGYYVLREITPYARGQSPSVTAAAVEVRGAEWRVARFAANNRAIERANFEVIEDGERPIQLQETCPQDTHPVYVRAPDGGFRLNPDGTRFLLGGMEPYALRYTQSGGRLLLITDDAVEPIAFTYVRER